MIKNRIAGFYQRLYFDNSGWRPNLEGVSFKLLGPEDRNFLEQPFVEEEVVAVLRSMRGDKAPGLDGFSMNFFFNIARR